MNYTFTPAVPGQENELIAFYRGFIGVPGCMWDEHYPSPEYIKDDIEKGYMFCLYDEAGVLVGACSIGFEPDFDHIDGWEPGFRRPCDLARLGIIPARQGRGLGAFLLERALEECKARGHDGIRLMVWVESPAAALYEKYGFVRDGACHKYEMDWFLYSKAIS